MEPSIQFIETSKDKQLYQKDYIVNQCLLSDDIVIHTDLTNVQHIALSLLSLNDSQLPKDFLLSEETMLELYHYIYKSQDNNLSLRNFQNFSINRKNHFYKQIVHVMAIVSELTIECNESFENTLMEIVTMATEEKLKFQTKKVLIFNVVPYKIIMHVLFQLDLDFSLIEYLDIYNYERFKDIELISYHGLKLNDFTCLRTFNFFSWHLSNLPKDAFLLFQDIFLCGKKLQDIKISLRIFGMMEKVLCWNQLENKWEKDEFIYALQNHKKLNKVCITCEWTMNEFKYLLALIENSSNLRHFGLDYYPKELFLIPRFFNTFISCCAKMNRLQSLKLPCYIYKGLENGIVKFYTKILMNKPQLIKINIQMDNICKALDNVSEDIKNTFFNTFDTLTGLKIFNYIIHNHKDLIYLSRLLHDKNNLQEFNLNLSWSEDVAPNLSNYILTTLNELKSLKVFKVSCFRKSEGYFTTSFIQIIKFICKENLEILHMYIENMKEFELGHLRELIDSLQEAKQLKELQLTINGNEEYNTMIAVSLPHVKVSSLS